MQEVGCRASLLELCRNPQYCYRAYRNGNGETLLHIACRNGHLDIVRALIEIYQFSLKIYDKFGNSPCHTACENGQLKIMNYFCRNLFSFSCPITNFQNDTWLHLACKSGVVPLVRMVIVDLLRHRTDVYHLPKKCNEYLDSVCSFIETFSYQHETIIYELPNNSAGYSPIHVACMNNHIHVVKFFFEEYFNFFRYRLSSIIPSLIIIAGKQKNSLLVSYLSQQEKLCTFTSEERLLNIYSLIKIDRIPSETTSPLEEPALFIAARHGDRQLFHYLLPYSDHPFSLIRNNNGDTLLHAACVSCSCELVEEIYNILLSENVKVEEVNAIVNSVGYSCLHLACEYGSLELTKFFIGKGCSISVATKDGYSSLHLSIIHNRKNIFDYLMGECDTDAVINAKTKKGETPLHIAASEIECIEYAKKIVSHPKFNSINDKDDSEETPLFNACRTGDANLVKILLNTETRCDISVQNKHHETVLFIATRLHNVEILELLLNNSHEEHKAHRSLLEIACYCNGFDQPEYADDKNPQNCIMLDYLKRNLIPDTLADDVNAINPDTGFTPLQRACRNKNLKVFRKLLSVPGIDCDIKDKEGNTVLHMCCEMKLFDFVQACLQKCSISIRNNKGDTPLHIAIAYHYYKILKYIIDNVEQVRLDNYVNEKGNNVLHETVEKINECVDFAKSLISRKLIDYKSRNSCTGDTALHIAIKKNREEMIEYFLNEFTYDESSWYNNDYLTPLYFMIQNHYRAKFMVKFAKTVVEKYSKSFTTFKLKWIEGFIDEPINVPILLFLIHNVFKTGCTKNRACGAAGYLIQWITQLIITPSPNIELFDSLGNSIFHYLAMCSYHHCKILKTLWTKSLIITINF